MKHSPGIIIFGIIEIFIGAITLITVGLSVVQGTSTKPLEILIFVIATSIISVGLGIGVLKRSLHAYHLLLFFATVIILSKVLILGHIISLSGELETTIPVNVKNIISIGYHLALICYFSRKPIKERFGERRGDLFSLRIPFLK